MGTTVKTAISIDSEVFRRVNELADRLHMSRSQFFSQAAQHMLDLDENLDLLQRINAVYLESTEERERATAAKRYTRRKVVEEW